MKKQLFYTLLVITICNAMDPGGVALIWDFYGVLVTQTHKDRAAAVLSVMKHKPITALALCNPLVHRRIKKYLHRMNSDSLTYEIGIHHWHLEDQTDLIRKFINNQKPNYELIEVIKKLNKLGYTNYIASTMGGQSFELMEEKYPELFDCFENTFCAWNDPSILDGEKCKPKPVYYRNIRKDIIGHNPNIQTLYCFEKRQHNVKAANKRSKFHAMKFKSNMQVKAWLFDQLSDHALKSLSLKPNDD